MFKNFYLLLFSIFCFSQNEFQIIQSKTLEKRTINNEKFEILSGDIITKHKQHILYCDTMLISQKNNFIKAWGNDKVLIKDTSDLIIESEKVFFFKNDSIINFKNDVLLIKGEQKIQTNNLTYNSKEKIAYYKDGGRVEYEKIIINSKNCKYEIDKESAHFSENVDLISEEYSILSEEINLNKEKKIIKFNSRTEIIKDSINIKGDAGFYHEKKEHLELFGNVIVEKSNKIHVFSEKLIDKNNISEFTIEPKMIIESEKGDFTISGQEIYINDIDSLLSVINNVYMYNDSIQGKSAQCFYNLKNKEISLIQKPVLWINKQQITGDTIFLYTKNESIDSIYIPNNPFISSKKENDYYNQIKGKTLSGKFSDNNIEYIDITGNSTLKYFNEKEREIDGVNDIISNHMKIYFQNSDIEKIQFKGNPDAHYTPIQLIEETKMLLDGFLIIENPD